MPGLTVEAVRVDGVVVGRDGTDASGADAIRSVSLAGPPGPYGLSLETLTCRRGRAGRARPSRAAT